MNESGSSFSSFNSYSILFSSREQNQHAVLVVVVLVQTVYGDIGMLTSNGVVLLLTILQYRRMFDRPFAISAGYVPTIGS